VGETESKIRHIFESEWTIRIALIVGTVSAYNFIMSPNWVLSNQITLLRAQVDTIKGNDLKHIEAALVRIEEKQEKHLATSENNNARLTKIETIIERKGGK
jgi:hypothetical protein